MYEKLMSLSMFVFKTGAHDPSDHPEANIDSQVIDAIVSNGITYRYE